MIQKYKIPLEEAQILTKDEVKTIFCNIQDIKQIEKNLYFLLSTADSRKKFLSVIAEVVREKNTHLASFWIKKPHRVRTSKAM